jgi:ATP-dependent exoDNAse (exonuclease V) alpha subunit
MAQSARLLDGALGSGHLCAGPVLFYENDRICFLRNNRLLGVQNGTLATITRISTANQTLTALLDTGRAVTISLSAYPHVDLGYALTTHKAQGTTAECAFVFLGDEMQDREMTYVQISRARGETRLYADGATADPELADFARRMSTSHRKELALEVMEPQQHQAQGYRIALRQGVTG